MSAVVPPRPSRGDAQDPSDEIFHLSPLFPLDHRTISPICYPAQVPSDITQRQQLQIPRDTGIYPSTSPLSPKLHDDAFSQFPDEEDESNDDPSHRNEINDVLYAVPCPQNSREAYLLLEAARADRRVFLARKTLACQIIHRNTLALQYNRMVLERAQDDLRHADRFIGHVRLLIRKSGQTAAFEYAMNEDPTSLSSEQVCNHSSVDVDLT